MILRADEMGRGLCQLRDLADTLVRVEHLNKPMAELPESEWVKIDDLDPADVSAVIGVVNTHYGTSFTAEDLEAWGTAKTEQAALLDRYRQAWTEVSETAALLTLDPSLPAVVVFFSAGWCAPCTVSKPTFAALSGSLASPVYFTDDADTAKILGVKAFPRLVGLLPGGQSIESAVGSTAQELWDNMRRLDAMIAAAVGSTRGALGTPRQPRRKRCRSVRG